MSRNPLLATTLLDSDSDDDSEMYTVIAMEEERLERERRSTRRRGSVPGRASVMRNLIQGHETIFRDYFAEQPVFGPKYFRRRYRMNRDLFCHIQQQIEEHDSYFVRTRNAAGIQGLSSHQKITAVFRMLTYGIPADQVDEYVRIGESTTIKSLKRFVKAVVEIFSDEYLRAPTSNDIARLLAIGERRGFPGMMGSIDCMHWKWKNCPTAWKGMYTGHIREPTIILEAVASYDLWIWHAFFGLPGSHNDINVLERSPVFSELAEGRAPLANYSINGHDYTMGYYLADGIYPQWSTFVKTIPSPQRNKKKKFAAAQESARKDIERAFEVLQACFAIICGPARFWGRQTLKYIIMACIILHNMIIQNERDLEQDAEFFQYDQINQNEPEPVSHEHTAEFMEFIRRHRGIRNREAHSQLQSDLIEHLWGLHSQS